MTPIKLCGVEILSWRRSRLKKGGRPVDLDWLLDIGGGLRWSTLQTIQLNPNRFFTLEKSLEDLAAIWSNYLENQIPLQYLVGRCPWRDFELEVSPAVLIPRQETEILVDIAVLVRVSYSILL